MNVSKVKKNELHDWIDTEVPQMVESRIEE